MKPTEILPLALGAVLATAALFALMAAPGLLSDRDSTVPLAQAQGARR